MKFGGTSVGDAPAFEQVAHIVKNARPDWPRLVVITSAMSGVTDTLLECAAQAVAGKPAYTVEAAQRLLHQHDAVLDANVGQPAERNGVKGEVAQLLSDLTNLCQAIAVLGEATPRALAAVSSLGERMSARILAAVFRTHGIPAEMFEASRLIVTDDEFLSAHPLMELTAQRTRAALGPILTAGGVPVVTGFLAANSEGVITTLGRGGSDYSAGILGAALPADEVWIWTDVDGVMTADPRLVPDARTIPELSYREIAELAYYGAKVVHPRTIRPVIEAGIALRVCNTFNPEQPGTRLVGESSMNNGGPMGGTMGGPSGGTMKAVTAIKGQSLVTVEGRGMLGVVGVAARTFAAVAATGTSVPLITQASSEQSICFAVPVKSVPPVLASLEAAFAPELARGDIDRVWATGEVTIITAVGVGMRYTPGVAGRIFTALGDQGVNVIAIAQGSSEVSISLVVDAADAEAGVRAIHALIRKEN
jgi:aspartate kinase